jgi:Trk-type K+ transport system membrane component
VDEAAVPSSWRAYVRFEAVWRLCCFVLIIWIVGGLLIRTGEWPLVAIGTVVLVTSALAVVGLVVDLWKQHNNRSR